MNAQELEILIKDLSALPKECEWVEFKVANSNPQEIGEYISALSNSACYHKKEFAWLVYGVEDTTHKLVGTDFRPLIEKKGNQELENWLVTQVKPRIDVSRKAIRVIFYKGNNRIHTIKEKTGNKGYAVGFEGLIKYLDEQLPSNEIIDTALRKRVSLYPLLAVRELVANALIHQDFSIKGSSPMVEVFSNRIEITNPGKPLIDPMRFVDHNPESRNEILARFMRRVNICEERGSGFDKVVFECEYNQLPAPEIIVGDNYTRIILYSYKTLRQMDKQDKVRACYLHACLKYVSGEHMTNQSLRGRFGIQEQSYPIASRIISDTIKAGLIKDYDTESKSRKYAKYVPYWF